MYRVANVLCFFIILKMWKFKNTVCKNTVRAPEPNYNSEIRSFPQNISKKLNYCLSRFCMNDNIIWWEEEKRNVTKRYEIISHVRIVAISGSLGTTKPRS